MFKTFVLLMEYAAMRSGNYLIYFLQKLPLIGKKVPNKWYRSEGKDIFYWLGGFFKLMRNFLGKTLYIVVLLGLPTLGYLALRKQTPSPEIFVEYGLYFFMVLNLFGAGLPNPIFLHPRTLIDYELVKLARIEEKRYYLLQLVFYFLNTSLIMILVLFVFNLFLPIGSANILLLGLSHVFARLIYEGISLQLFDRFGFDLQAKPSRSTISAAVPLLPAYLVPLFVEDLSFSRVILHPLFVGSIIMLGSISLLTIVRSKAFVRISNIKINLLDIRKRVADASNVRMMSGRVRDQDIILEVAPEKLDGLRDYTYLHRIFFERYRPTLQRNMRLRIGGYLLAFVAATIAGLLFRDSIRQYFPAIATGLIQFSFYYFYFIGSYGERFTKILFVNMDYHLLPYSFFREPEAVTKSLAIRFNKLLELGLVPTLVLSGLFSLWAVIFTGIQFWQNIIMVNAVFIILTLFFNLHHLIIYHTFQPYNRNMEVKSPLTAVINLVIYVITFTMWRTTNLPTVVYLIVLVVMIIYVIGGIQLMKRLAPKNFKMKT